MSTLEFPKRSGPSVSWPGRVDLAKSEAEVVEAARDYLASLDPFEVDRLPDHCKPRKLFDAQDISSYAFDLMRTDCAEESAAVVHRVAAFFVHANGRLAQLLAKTNDPESERRERA
ncbi:MAG TPA: hypothetical protein VLY46_14585 [Usitatibacter sp.]|nr:hypothetical protein [Usitatibacter sp.]